MDLSKAVFLDTSFLKAFIDEKDDFHTEAFILGEKFDREEILHITSNYILDESFTLIRLRCGLTKAEELKKLIVRYGKRCYVLRVTSKDDIHAWDDWFVKPWSRLSFTDCTSFAVMKRLGLTRVATFDGHFVQAGFTVEK